MALGHFGSVRLFAQKKVTTKKTRSTTTHVFLIQKAAAVKQGLGSGLFIFFGVCLLMALGHEFHKLIQMFYGASF